ncbi:His-Xaa-Ser system radical SAM maturase HxsC [Mesorhizobium sp.]|uniref:His-Xaa-Ser system radical SAM maturase HxsC n=1 Tax=Mesorhizobium sp. TaxID=1871066 RepID=UPI000FE3B51A|nr:His-Xaa-Ser system radical SAM maturase HxsC [Mesorhizobium sp.]RWQ22732.1 MAG: His-Xaa-Ser system radical SAM maturase HxsC [Mesorhizobium sp.]
MIPLRLPIDQLPLEVATVTRLRGFDRSDSPHALDAFLISRDDAVAEYDLCGMSLRVNVGLAEELENDVLLLLPGQKSAHRLIRAGSKHNTFLVTERCDQLCVMCSQPPKTRHVDLFACFEEAAMLAPRDAYLGISGGEPTLFKDQLFALMERVLTARPDLRFHVLTNGQHFEPSDTEIIRALGNDRVLWGIPLYSPFPDRHDQIVAKQGAYVRLMRSLAILANAGAAIELRTVVLDTNVEGLPELARSLSIDMPFISIWAIMQLEDIGYGRKNWRQLFCDTSISFGPIAKAVDIAEARGLTALLYNFPLCTVPARYRLFAPATISDWKRKFLDNCKLCSAKSSCGGFFEWYRETEGFRGVRAI